MAIDHVLAVVPVVDIDIARPWDERLLGRAADNRRMDTLAEWRVTDSGGVQVHVDPGRAGSALFNFAVDDLTAHLRTCRAGAWSPSPEAGPPSSH